MLTAARLPLIAGVAASLGDDLSEAGLDSAEGLWGGALLSPAKGRGSSSAPTGNPARRAAYAMHAKLSSRFIRAIAQVDSMEISRSKIEHFPCRPAIGAQN